MTGDSKQVGINFSGLIQEFVLKERISFVFLIRNFIWKIIIKPHIGLVIWN